MSQLPNLPRSLTLVAMDRAHFVATFATLYPLLWWKQYCRLHGIHETVILLPEVPRPVSPPTPPRSPAPLIQTPPRTINTGPCTFCQENGHTRHNCPTFSVAKKKCSPIAYIERQLKEEDNAGFCAAGVLVYTRVRRGRIWLTLTLMIQETREGTTRYNFLGGKRDRKAETPQEVAIRELQEETTRKDGTSLLSATLQKRLSDPLTALNGPVVWAPLSKYALFTLRVNYTDITTGPAEYGNLCTWVNINHIKANQVPVHDYAKAMIRDLVL